MPSATRVTLFTLGGVVLAAGVGSVAFTGLIVLSSHDVRAKEQFAYTGDHLTITSDGGGVRLFTGSAGVVDVDRKVTESIWGADPKWDLDQTDGKLRLDTNCKPVFNATCDGDYDVAVPAAVKTVTVRNGNGSVTIDGMRVNSFDLESDNGAIRVKNSSATELLKMSSDNGSINVDESLATHVDASSDNGSINVKLGNEPASVKATSDNGSLKLTLPPGPRNYKLTTDADNGSKNVSAFEQNLVDPASGYILELSSDNGSLKGYIGTEPAVTWPPEGAVTPAPGP